MANALSIAGSDSVGGAGLQADLKAFEAVGVHACSVVTCVTSQNTKGVSSIFPVPEREIASQMDSVLEDVDLDAIKTGMLYSAEIVKIVASKVKDLRTPIVVDPVMAATTGSSLHTAGFVETLTTKLLPLSTLVTPNLVEAMRLTGLKVHDERSARRAASEILEFGPKAVLLKGGHLKGAEAADYLVTRKVTEKFASPRIGCEVHGTGCTFASLIAAHLAVGSELADAVRRSKSMIYKAIVARESVGLGVPCANPLAVLRIEASKHFMLAGLESAGEDIEDVLTSQLIPEVGINMGWAALGALESEEVAAFEGRIVRVGERARRTGHARFGASKHVARIVLAVTSHDPEIRCAMNLKYSPENLKACRKAKLTTATFDRSREPNGVSSMTWGVHTAIRIFGGVPDLIYDRGGMGKEPMIRLLGRDPDDVIAKLARIVDCVEPG